jgi:nucleoside 2-deoxyribosyltransferase
MSKSPRVYLAGPDVFLPRPLEAAAAKKQLCAQYGFEGVFPLDAELELAGLPPLEAALRISRANEDLIRSCELVIAHVTPFRGPSADVGTAYEMGFARALGKRVFAYTNVELEFATRTERWVREVRARPDGQREDEHGMQLESFGLDDNLMLIGAVVDSGGALVRATAPPGREFSGLAAFEACLQQARSVLDSSLH